MLWGIRESSGLRTESDLWKSGKGQPPAPPPFPLSHRFCRCEGMPVRSWSERQETLRTDLGNQHAMARRASGVEARRRTDPDRSGRLIGGRDLPRVRAEMCAV